MSRQIRSRFALLYPPKGYEKTNFHSDPDLPDAVPELCFPVPASSLYTANRVPLTAKPYLELPLGAIQPQGWLRQQLQPWPQV
jgi:hypothetical protein